MQHVSVEKGKLVVRLNSSFYSKKAVTRAAEEFSNACDSKITRRGKFFCICLLPRSKELCIKETGLLFCNFALAAMQAR